ncbi:tRNA(Met) cytidine acetyltransferase TmcA [Providencia alcalifaciens]|nr:tRNA(Met) cytidine acetyltransferase TmcA [Providencia alcalifaciens]
MQGMLIKQWQGKCWCCAPAKVSTRVVAEYAEHELEFWAPDALLHYCEFGQTIDADWLIIDEAAAIPNAHATKNYRLLSAGFNDDDSRRV